MNSTRPSADAAAAANQKAESPEDAGMQLESTPSLDELPDLDIPQEINEDALQDVKPMEEPADSEEAEEEPPPPQPFHTRPTDAP